MRQHFFYVPFHFLLKKNYFWKANTTKSLKSDYKNMPETANIELHKKCYKKSRPGLTNPSVFGQFYYLRRKKETFVIP